MGGGSGVIAPAFLTLTVDIGERSVSCPGHFTPRKKSTILCCIGDQSRPMAGLAAVASTGKLNVTELQPLLQEASDSHMAL